ncbi:hypothetical protein PUR34_32485 [Streptomyces sp. JV185]|uniref:hypothetical protein n=1 Tax=Streptomyces sp. JV185 TaxID=858638 RepID=UPI002E791C8C|nr:hypothetical protein [Streptomyces sp. JV185]MEE1772749.1 hypothetical protein [Streptomyces sp. JV185]
MTGCRRARLAGAATISAIDLDDQSLETARALSATHTVSAKTVTTRSAAITLGCRQFA